MNENLDLVEILKDCPSGTKLYSPIFGELVFKCIIEDPMFPIRVDYSDVDGNTRNTSFTKDGKYLDLGNGECMLFPSKDQRDWSKFKVSKPKFDPKTLHPFDKVLVSDEHHTRWRCSFFSHIVDKLNYKYFTTDSCYKLCIPYNDETKHLVGTTEEAPEYYRYWDAENKELKKKD